MRETVTLPVSRERRMYGAQLYASASRSNRATSVFANLTCRPMWDAFRRPAFRNLRKVIVVTFQRAAKSDGEKKSGSCVSSVFMMSGVVH